MSEPKVVQRYSPLHMSWSAGMKPDDEGMCVLHSDYAALAKRLEELEAAAQEATSVLQDVCADLRAEITRLREALERLEGPLESLHDAKWGAPDWDNAYNELMESVEAKRQALRGED